MSEPIERGWEHPRQEVEGEGVWLVRPKDDPPYVICQSWEGVRQCILADEAGTEWLVKREMLTQEQIDAAPEFDGW